MEETARDGEAGKTERMREGQGAGGGLCLKKAWFFVYYKLKIIPSLVCSRHGEGGVCTCVSVVPTAGRLRG